ncbi:MAG: hypothetical protein IT184_00780 [Acidobacteria bacterium]|nr:hypothetical protein [Acidobacteriota bacterium]
MWSLGLLVAGATSAAAQATPTTARVFVNANVAVQTGSPDVTTRLAFDLYNEPATLSVTRGTGGIVFDVTGGIPLRGPWSVGVNVNGGSSTSDGRLTADLPDPIRFDSPRAITGNVPSLVHRELWIGGVVLYDLPIRLLDNQVTAQAFAGPAAVRVQEDLVSSIDVSEPGDTPELDSHVGRVSKTLVGVQVGLDLKYDLTERVDVGVLLRYQRASGSLPGDTKIKVGGFQIGGGVRLRF